MSSAIQQQRLLIDNKLSALPVIEAALEAFFVTQQLPDELLGEMMLVAEELVVNTIQYGYSDGSAHSIEITLALHGEHFEMQFTDDAAEFNPLEKTLPELGLPASEAPIGGLGLPMVMALSDEQHYQRLAHKNIVRIIKHITLHH